jgi:hypothetical protein
MQLRDILIGAGLALALAGCTAAEKSAGESQTSAPDVQTDAGGDAVEAVPGDDTAAAGPDGSIDDIPVGSTDGASDNAGEGATGNGTDAAVGAPDPGDDRSPAVLPPPPRPGDDVARRDQIFCAAIRARTSQARCDALIEQQNSLSAGVAAFNPPREMALGQPTRVTLPIGEAVDRAAVVSSAGGPAGGAQTVAVRIGRYMTATLSGSAFDIKPIGEAQRDLGGSNAETWEWDVTPTGGGRQNLRVQIESFAEDEAGARTRIALFRSNPIDVDVTVTAERKRQDALGQATREITATTPLLEALTKWLGALAALILVAGIVWWRIRNFSRKPKDDDPAPE